MSLMCVCGSGTAFEVCCGPVVGGMPAVTAEALMRSRYTAFTMGNWDYLEATNSARAAELFDRAELEAQSVGTEWLGLEIRSTLDGGEGDETGVVVFAAKYKFKGQMFTQVEISEFVRVDGQWRYDWGTIELEKDRPNSVVKVGRNDPCTCGSGQKFKKCCGK